MKELMKKNIDVILIAIGVIAAVVGNLIGWALHIPLTFSLYSAILLLFTIGVLATGLILLGERIRKTNPGRRMAIRYSVAFIGLIMIFIDIAWFVGGIFG